MHLPPLATLSEQKVLQAVTYHVFSYSLFLGFFLVLAVILFGDPCNCAEYHIIFRLIGAMNLFIPPVQHLYGFRLFLLNRTEGSIPLQQPLLF